MVNCAPVWFPVTDKFVFVNVVKDLDITLQDLPTRVIERFLSCSFINTGVVASCNGPSGPGNIETTSPFGPLAGTLLLVGLPEHLLNLCLKIQAQELFFLPEHL